MPVKGKNAAETKPKHAGGRPMIIQTVEEMQRRIDAYFDECDGHPLEDKDGSLILNKYDEQIMIGEKPYTMTGLALAIGLNSRQALLNYQGRAEFNDTITRAKARVEQYAESRLFDRDGANGAKFSLANNFKQWKEKQELELSGSIIKVQITDD